MADCSISVNEQTVLGALVKYPHLNDRELAQHLEFKLSTFSAIKSRLKKKGCYFSVRMPNWPMLGCELMVATNFTFFPTVAPRMREAIRTGNVPVLPEIVYGFTESVNFFALSMHPKYTSLEKNLKLLDAHPESKGILASGTLVQYIFPLSLTRFFNYFEFSSVMDHVLQPDALSKLNFTTGKSVAHWSVEHKSKGEAGTGVAFSPGEMPLVDRKVLKALVRMPDSPDREIARTVSVSRQTVSKLRREFLDTGLVYESRMPDMTRLGFEILVAFTGDFSPGADDRGKDGFCRNLAKSYPGFFLARNMSQVVGLFLFSDFDSYNRMRTDIHVMARKNSLFKSEPSFIPYSVENMLEHVPHDYSHIMDVLLG